MVKKNEAAIKARKVEFDVTAMTLEEFRERQKMKGELETKGSHKPKMKAGFLKRYTVILSEEEESELELEEEKGGKIDFKLVMKNEAETQASHKRKIVSAVEVDSRKERFLARESWTRENQRMKRELEERIPLIDFLRSLNFAKNVFPKIVRLLEAKGNLNKFVENSREADSHINWRKRKFGDGFAVEEEESEESDFEEVVSESELENAVKSPPVEVKDLSYYFGNDSEESESEEEPESEEDVLGDSDREEKDYGVKFVVKKRSRTVTNPKVPRKIYFRRNAGKQRISTTNSVLHDPDFPVAAISKLALKIYNRIQKTKYKYVGLVKAYSQPVNGFYFWTRFKARLRGQDAIYFQASTFQERQDPESNVVYVRFESVYPLPPS